MRSRWFRILNTISLAFVALYATSAATQTKAGVLEISPDTVVRELFEHLVHAPAAGSPCHGDGIEPLGTLWIEAETSACLSLKNIGTERGTWRIDFEGIIGQGYTFSVVQGREAKQVLTAPQGRSLSQLETGGPWLASLPISILPDETVEIWVRFDALTNLATPVSNSRPRLVPEQTFDADTRTRLFLLGGQLACSALLIAFFFAFAHLLSFRPARRYAFYFAAATLFLVAYDGYLVALFPNQSLNLMLMPNRFIEMAMIILYFRFIASFVSESIGRHRLVSMVRWFIWGVPLALIAGGLVAAAGETLKLDSFEAWGMTEFGAWLGGVAPCVYGAIIIAVWTTLSLWSSVLLVHRRTDGALLFAAGAVLLMLAPLYGALGPGVFGWPQADLFRDGLILVDAIIFAAAMVRLTFALRAERDRAAQEALAATEEKLRLSEGLLGARKDLDRARGLAEQHRSKLALTGHDLRQPLMSLGLALDEDASLSRNLRDSLDTSVSYLKSVLDKILVDTRPAEHGPALGAKPVPESEPMPVQILLENAVRMFQSEAEAKGLSIRAVPTSVVVATNPVALIRIISNFVSNAVKYTLTGGILIGVRRRNGAIAVEVYDTGPGLSADEMQAISRPYGRGHTSNGTEGEGLGLESVQILARENGLTLTIKSTPRRGSRFSVEGLLAV